MIVKISNVEVDKFLIFIKKLLVVDDFIYLNINNNNIKSTCYLEERDAVKLQNIKSDEILNIDNLSEEDIKICFLNGNSLKNTLTQLRGLDVSCEITYSKLDKDLVADEIKFISDELIIKLPCTDPSLGFDEMTEEQIKTVFGGSDSSLFNFEIQPFHLEKLKQLFGLEKEKETFDVIINKDGVRFRGETYDSLIDSTKKSDNEEEVSIYKKYINLLDKESYRVIVSSHKIVWTSLDSTSMLSNATISS